MERRAEPRFAAGKPVPVTILGSQDRRIEGVIADASGSGIRLLLPESAPLDAAVRIDLEDGLILGEVRHCSPEGGRFSVGIEICHSLVRLDRLAHLRSHFLEGALHSR